MVTGRVLGTRYGNNVYVARGDYVEILVDSGGGAAK
jgi:hypothetical protein